MKTATADGLYYRGLTDCCVQVYKRYGVAGFYKGVGLMAWREIPSFGLYMICYESLYDVINKSRLSDSRGIIASLLAGGCAGTACWTVIIPFDVVKNCYQSDVGNTKYTSVLDCSKKLYKAGGIPAFFRGLQITAIRAFLVNAVTFLVYSQTMKHLRDGK